MTNETADLIEDDANIRPAESYAVKRRADIEDARRVVEDWKKTTSVWARWDTQPLCAYEQGYLARCTEERKHQNPLARECYELCGAIEAEQLTKCSALCSALLQKLCNLPAQSTGSGPDQTAVRAGVLFDDYTGMFDASDKAAFSRIDAELMRDIKEMKAALTEFDASRQCWAEIVACNNAPGRDSELRKRLQGKALSNLDAAAWRLRIRIRGEDNLNAHK